MWDSRHITILTYEVRWKQPAWRSDQRLGVHRYRENTLCMNKITITHFDIHHLLHDIGEFELVFHSPHHRCRSHFFLNFSMQIHEWITPIKHFAVVFVGYHCKCSPNMYSWLKVDGFSISHVFSGQGSNQWFGTHHYCRVNIIEMVSLDSHQVSHDIGEFQLVFFIRHTIEAGPSTKK